MNRPILMISLLAIGISKTSGENLLMAHNK
jgi:hypothetical protein